MRDTIVLDGDLSIVIEEIADCQLSIPESGEVGLVTVIREGTFPAYTGATEITPSQETQTLNTANKSVYQNIVVNPIPSNYGLITWDGSKLMVS